MKKKSLKRLSAFFNISLVILLLLPNFIVSASVFAIDTAPSINGIVGSTTADSTASYASSYLRYVGNPAPSGFSHAYQWEDPYYVCDPNSNPVVFTGTINVSSMNLGGVAFLGLIDKGLLESGKAGYQSGAYAYIYKNSSSTLIIGPTDGNIGNGEIVQVFKSYPIPVDGIINLQITIYDGKVDLQVNDDTVLSDDYGFVKTLNNSNVYSWNEFGFKAVPGWDNYETGSVPYSFLLTGCQEILPPDTTAPVVKLISPSDNYFTKLKSVLQTWESDDTDIDYYEYESCSNDPDADGFCTRIYSVTTDNTTRTVNNNNIAFWWRVRAVDLTENVGSWTEARKITIDTVSPTKPVFTAPENNLMSTVNSITLNWTGGDDSGSGIKNHIFGYTFTSAQTGNVSFWNTGLLPGNPHTRTGSYGHGEGKYEFYVKTIDYAGNESPLSDILTVYYDGTAPVMPLGLYWKDLDNNQQIMCGGYSNTHHVSEYWDAVMGDVSFSHYEYSSFNAPNGSAGLVERRFDTNFFDSSWWNIPMEGTYGFRVRSVDTFGNKSNWALTDPIGFEGSCKITIDWTAPVVEITNPSNNTYVKGTVSFKGSVADKNLLRYYYYIGGVVGNTVVTDLAFTDKEVYSWNTTSNPDGLYIMRLEARDKANNKTAASVHEIKVTVDNTLPTGEITGIRYPTADSTNFITNDNTPLIYGTYGDNFEVDKVEVKIGDILGTVALNGNWTAQFPILPEGIQTISLKITDKAGNITEVTKDITIDSVAPSAVYTHYIKGELFDGDIAEVKSLSDLSFTGEYKDPNPSSELKYDSFVIFQAQDDGSFRFAANGKQSYCSWRTSPNLVDLSGSTYNLTDQIPFTNCIASLPDGEYYMSHQVFDNAVRNDIPTISQFRDVLGLHFKINNTPVVTITIPFTEVVQGTASFTVQADAIDGNAPLEYEWTASNGFTSTEKSFTFMPVLVGVYTYTVKVTDADGDMDQKSVTITVKAPTIEQPQDIQAVLGTTNTTMTPVVTRRPLSAASVFETTPEVVEEEISVLPEILGEEDISCVAKAVSGHVYLDKNENNAWDKDDKAFSNIKINITTKDENDEKIVEEFTTNEEGEWKTTLCAGKYLVSIDTTSIPENYKLNGDSTIQIDVLEGDTKGVEQSFLLTESKTFLQKYWWILLLAILVVTSIVIAGSKKDEKQSS